MPGGLLELLHRELDRDRRGVDGGDALRAGSQALLLPTPHEQRLQAAAGPADEDANARGSSHLVGAEAREVGPPSIQVDGDLPEGLHGIHQQRGVRQCSADRWQVLDRPGLTVGGLDRDEVGLPRELVDADCSILQDPDDLGRPRIALTGRQHRRVLDRRGRHVAPAFLAADGSGDGEVEGLGAARGEQDLLLPHPEGARHALAGLVQQGASGASRAMGAGRVEGTQLQGLQQRLAGLRAEGRGGVVVEVDGAHRASARTRR